MEEGVAGGNFWEERVGQALSITITAASASLLSALSASHCYIFVFVLLAVKQKNRFRELERVDFLVSLLGIVKMEMREAYLQSVK